MNQPVLFVYRKKKEYKKMSRAKNPKYENFGFWGYFIKCKNIIFSGENF